MEKSEKRKNRTREVGVGVCIYCGEKFVKRDARATSCYKPECRAKRYAAYQSKRYYRIRSVKNPTKDMDAEGNISFLPGRGINSKKSEKK